MRFQKGTSGNADGRPKGAVNKMTSAAREAFQFAFDKLGGAEQLAIWAKDNQAEFYKLYGRLIPLDVRSGDDPVIINVVTGVKRAGDL